MSRYTKQIVYCNNCGFEMESDFLLWGGRFCGKNCNDEFNLKKSHSICGTYYPSNRKRKIRDILQKI